MNSYVNSDGIISLWDFTNEDAENDPEYSAMMLTKEDAGDMVENCDQ